MRGKTMDIDSLRKPRPRFLLRNALVAVAAAAAAAAGSPALADEKPAARSITASLVKLGFDEREIFRVTEQFGAIANVFSTYESRRTPAGPVIARGINSLQLFHDGKRWWIASATWQDESRGNPIPAKFLPPPKTP